MTRHRRNVGLLVRFGVVGASGVLVNLLTLVVLRRFGPHFDDAVLALGSSGFNLRWYHVYSTIAFLVANLSNFQLNRTWTFKSNLAAPWWREYWPFLAVGLVGQVIGLALLTLLMHPALRHQPAARRLRRLLRAPQPALLVAAHRDRGGDPPVVRAQQAVDVRRRPHRPAGPARGAQDDDVRVE